MNYFNSFFWFFLSHRWTKCKRLKVVVILHHLFPRAIRPIAFRPTPGRPSSSTGPLPPSRPGSSAPSPGPLMSTGHHHTNNSGLQLYSTGPLAPPSRPGSSAPSPGVGPPYSRPPSQGFAPGQGFAPPSQGFAPGQGFAPPSQGFAPGHPLVRDGPRPFGSK